MNKRYIYASLVSAMAWGFSACDEDYTNWAAPQSYEQEAASPKVTGSMKAVVEKVDYASADEYVSLVSVASSDASSAVLVNALFVNDYEVVVDMDGDKVVVAKENLQNAVKMATGSQALQSVELSISAAAVSMDKDGVSTPVDLNPVTISYTSAAPDETLASLMGETEFFYIGTAEGWNYADVLPFTNNGDGTHSLVLTVADESEWYKFASKSAVEAADWSNLLGCAVNGSTASRDFIVANGESMLIEGGGTFTFTIDTKSMSYSVAPYVESLYYAGDANGWNFSPMVKNGDNFVGYYYVNAVDDENTWGFKFTSDSNWDGTSYGAGETAGSLAVGGGNVNLGQADGFYQIAVNLADLSVSLSPISTISIVGSAAGSWEVDSDLAFNAETKAWEGSFDLVNGEFKFRANHDWAISWGGDANALTSNNGANLSIEETGNYSISFIPNADGFGVVTISKN